MATQVPPKRGAAFSFDIALVDQGDTDVFQETVTLAAGDIQVSKDGAQYANLATFPPAEILLAGGAASGTLRVVLTALEMTADTVTVLFRDAAAAEWQSALVTIHTATQQVDDIPTDADNADAVWDEALAGHLGVGSTGKALDAIEACTCGGGAIAFTYTVTNSATGLPIDGVEVWISTDAAGANIVWNGYTDAFGVARSLGGTLPMLNAGNYYFWKQLAGLIDDQNPDLEAVP